MNSTKMKNNVRQSYPHGEVERGKLEEVMENLKVGDLVGNILNILKILKGSIGMEN